NALDLDLSVHDVECHGELTGDIMLTVTGGAGSYSYEWSNNATSQNLIDVGAGNYSVTVTDGNGCMISDAERIAEPDELVIIVDTIVHVECFGENTGSVSITTQGGTMPYTWAWSHGANTEDLSGLGAGSYTLTVTDDAGCSTTQMVTISQPAQLTYTVDIVHVDCIGNN